MLAVQPRKERLLSSAHDPYAGMKTPGQRQLIALQERVKVGSLTVDEAVQEFKAWKFDQDKRSCSVRFQQVMYNGGCLLEEVFCNGKLALWAKLHFLFDVLIVAPQ